VLAEGDETYLLSNAKTIASWSPSSTMQGLYRVISAESSPECSTFSAPSVEVVEVKMEQPLEQEIAEESTSSEPTLALPSEETSAVVAVTTVVITASLLSVIGLVAITNESLRIPATMAGLWFLGLIGKTHETTDGRYQRGRLMGYLTANPGCHFRALMSALDMSNGQITHHLRVLEAEEHIWRKNDGRLVRYYPLTNQLHPNMNESELPVPPLSPDPNSLQGKILNLLDQDGGLGQFPTQAELAKRLEKSQQLISHHLRTLQKYGLVERRKMGVKNRYKLTREAIFLLETSDDFGDQNL
jgi:predicted transcriptional regulator